MLNLSSLNPQQREAVETLRGPVLILAGAGTGKTRVITYRIAHLIAKGVAPENVLAVTFTNKAAREMQERIRKLIPAPRKQDADGRSASDQRPTICTFHSLCVRILRRHIEKLGYKSNFVIYDQSEQLSVVKKILSQISAKGEKTDPAAVLSLLSRFKNGGGKAAARNTDSSWLMNTRIPTRRNSSSSMRWRKNTGIFALSATTTRVFTAGAARKSAIFSTSKSIFLKSRWSSWNKTIARPTPSSTPP